MHSNNDLMDPNWKPEPTPVNKKSSIYKMKKLVDDLWPLISVLEKAEKLDDDSYNTAVKMNNSNWRDILKSFKDMNGDL